MYGGQWLNIVENILANGQKRIRENKTRDRGISERAIRNRFKSFGKIEVFQAVAPGEGGYPDAFYSVR